MNDRLTIEAGMKQVNHMNRTLTSLVSEFKDLKITVAKVNNDVKNLTDRSSKHDLES